MFIEGGYMYKDPHLKEIDIITKPDSKHPSRKRPCCIEFLVVLSLLGLIFVLLSVYGRIPYWFGF